MSMSWISGNMNMGFIPSPSGYRSSKSVFPKDAESSDEKEMTEIMEKYMENKYPPVEPQMLMTLEKDYYIPALKVLMIEDGKYISPSKEDVWEDMQLEAECKNANSIYIPEATTPHETHSAPNENCDCGIYGSVNIEEVAGYMLPQQKARYVETKAKRLFGAYSYNYESEIYTVQKVLCIIEPSENADVIVCRKGWKASKAFISEIVGETISIEETSQLLSMAWNRNIDIRSLYENW